MLRQVMALTDGTTIILLLTRKPRGLISSLAAGQVRGGKDGGNTTEGSVQAFLLGHRNTRLTARRSHELTFISQCHVPHDTKVSVGSQRQCYTTMS